jgi:hypothetical protein
MYGDPFSFAIGSSTLGEHGNPYYNYTQRFTPRRLKDLFIWCEYLFYNSPHVYAALRKFGEYPITTLTYDTENTALKRNHTYLLEKVLKVREILIQGTLDKYVYGNGFISMYQPFLRYLKCPKCGMNTNIKSINYKFDLKQLKFSYDCSGCHTAVSVGKEGIIDRKQLLSKRVNFIRWDPKYMDIDYNAVTGESVYYYTIPPDILQKVRLGHKTLIDTLPIGFLDAIRLRKQFKFNQNAVYHLKVGGPAGINPQWGLPPLLSVMSKFHYTEILRKANEAIALDHLVPFRVLHPAQSTGSNDPMVQMSLSNWADTMQAQLKAWRRDNLRIMFSPVPLGATQVGGQGRALLTLGEVQEAEKGIVASLGIPMEFLYGGLTGAGMETTLRLIENQLETHINDLLDLLQWIDDSCAKFLGWERIDVGMTKFRMVDDQVAKQVVFQMWLQGKQSGEQHISDATIMEMYDIDQHQEEDRIMQETLDKVRRSKDMDQQVQELQNSLAERVRLEVQQAGNTGASYNTDAIMQQAQQYGQMLMQMEPGMKQSKLHALQVTDPVMYAVVVRLLEQAQTSARQEAASAVPRVI